MFASIKQRIAVGLSLLAFGVALPLAAGANDNKTVRADEIIGSTVSDGFDPIGSVRDLMLDESLQQVQYVLYEVHEPFGVFSDQGGFAAMNKVTLERGYGPHDYKVRFKDEESQQAPEELKLTKREADHRLLSNLINEPIYFGDQGTREVKDIMIDRDTGKIQSYIVEMNPDSLFNDQVRAIPADEVEVDKKGVMTTSVELESVVGQEEYRLGSL